MSSIASLQVEMDRLYVQLELANLALEKHQNTINEQTVAKLDKRIDELIDQQLALEEKLGKASN